MKPTADFVKKLTIGTISLFLLFFGFYSNNWNIAEEEWFLSFQQDTESLIMGRMVKSRQDGIFSSGGLLGAGIPDGLQQQWIAKRYVSKQYSAYFNERTFDDYSPYFSQIGGQGMSFSLLDRLLPSTPKSKLQTFYLLTSLLSAIALTSIILWFYAEFGLSAGIFVASSMVFSQWLTVFGRNLWWNLWAFYLPMIAVMYFLKNKTISTKRHLFTFGILSFVVTLVKSLANGYEYITTTLVMMVIPLVYYSVMNKLDFRQLFKRLLTVASGASIAVALSLMILSIQIGSVKGSILYGFSHIAYAFGKRTYGGIFENYSDTYTASLEANIIGVIRAYLKGVFVDLNNFLNISVPNPSLQIHYWQLIILFLLISVFVFFNGRKNIPNRQRQKNLALIITTWASILAPLSWYVIFKAHSYKHTHMNHLLWQMPFTFFGFALLGIASKDALLKLIRFGNLPSISPKKRE